MLPQASKPRAQPTIESASIRRLGVTATIARIIDSFAAFDVLAIGHAMLDSYLPGAAGELCREAPVPIVKVSERIDMPGGAANTAANARSLGGRVRLLSAIGDDAEGRLLAHILE